MREEKKKTEEEEERERERERDGGHSAISKETERGKKRKEGGAVMTTVFLVTGFSMLFSAGVMVYNCKREREREITNDLQTHTHTSLNPKLLQRLSSQNECFHGI